MATDTATTETQPQTETANLPSIGKPRLPYHPLIEERFGVDRASWKALVEAVFPAAQKTESVILALSYCRARKLDPFKRNVHIVPIWDKERKGLVDTVWPGIGELRTTAFRTGQYAGRDRTEFGPDKTDTWRDGNGNQISVTFPEWAQVTVYRMKDGQRVAFAGPQVYWLETYSEMKGGAPNSMWQKRPRGQLDKCAEAAALRAAFPEEIGDEFTDAEAGLIHQHGRSGQAGVTLEHEPAPPAEHSGSAKLDKFADATPAAEPANAPPTPQYELIDENGEARPCNSPEAFEAALTAAMRRADRPEALDGLWETNAPQIDKRTAAGKRLKAVYDDLRREVAKNRGDAQREDPEPQPDEGDAAPAETDAGTGGEDVQVQLVDESAAAVGAFTPSQGEDFFKRLQNMIRSSDDPAAVWELNKGAAEVMKEQGADQAGAWIAQLEKLVQRLSGGDQGQQQSSMV